MARGFFVCYSIALMKTKPHTFPRHFPFARLRYNAPGAWPDADLRHEGIMNTIREAKASEALHRYHFHTNEDGTLTPLSRAMEWHLATLQAMGRKTFRLW